MDNVVEVSFKDTNIVGGKASLLGSNRPVQIKLYLSIFCI